jgi:4-hydroxy-3-polyprenylbenzoate decarboxylase
MSFADLPDFLERLEKDGDLVRVKAQVDPYLEITEIVDRVVRASGPALLFENVKGSKMPLAMNVFGTTARMARALGVGDLDEIGARIGDLLKPELPKGFAGLKDAMSKLGQLRDVPPKTVRKGDCQDVVMKGDKVDLMSLPALHTWPDDGGSYFNLGLTHTKHPETGQRNLGLYRLQRHDARTVAMHWQIHKDSNAHHAVAEQRGERLPVAIAFGCDPVVTYAASAPLPSDIDEYLFAGFLRQERDGRLHDGTPAGAGGRAGGS